MCVSAKITAVKDRKYPQRNEVDLSDNFKTDKGQIDRANKIEKGYAAPPQPIVPSLFVNWEV